jgi:hypothetical protein
MDDNDFTWEKYFSGLGSEHFNHTEPTPENEPTIFPVDEGEFVYCDFNPDDLREMRKNEVDPEKIRLMDIALRVFDGLFGVSQPGFTEAGYVYRGEDREAKRINSLREAVGTDKAEQVTSVGYLDFQRGILDSLPDMEESQSDAGGELDVTF